MSTFIEVAGKQVKEFIERMQKRMEHINPDFYQLHIGQKVWVDGKEKTIHGLDAPIENRYIKFDNDCNYWQKYSSLSINLTPPPQKRKVTLYRRTYINKNGWIWQTCWETGSGRTDVKLLLTETKKIEIEGEE